MSLSGSYSGISFTGLGSGIDTESIIKKLMDIERQGVNRIQVRQAEVQTQMSVYDALKSQLDAFSASINRLNSSKAFTAVAGSSSDTDVATLSAGDGAIPGTYNLEVSKLAQAHKVSSAAQAGTDTALGKTGTFFVNGKAVTVVAEDTLTAVAKKINDAGAGVSATLLNGGTGQAYLTLTSQTSGAKGAITLSQGSGDIMAGLGLLSGVATVRESPSANVVRSFGLSSSSQTLKTLTGASGNRSFAIGPDSVNVNFDTDSLDSIASKINLETNANATVVAVTENGKTVHKLEITTDGTPDTAIDDSSGVLEDLGVYQRSFGSPLLAAQDAAYKLDGFSFTSATNSVSGVIPGVSFTLVAADAATPKKATFTVSSNTTSLKNDIKAFRDSYNAVTSFIRENSQFDTETFQSGLLFADSVASQVQSTLDELFFNTVPTAGYKSLSEVGFSIGSDGLLSLDEAKLDSAIASNPKGIRELFMATGSVTDENLAYVSASSKTKNGTYAVNITQVATYGAATAGTAQTTANVGNEKLTFNGSLFANSPIEFTVDAGSTLDELVIKINNDTRLKDKLAAANVGGQLVMTSKRYGTPGSFSVVSNLDAAANTSGVGTSAILGTGLDVAGTINGEAATGSGQFLTGATGNATTEGLQIQYKGTTTGAIGNVRYTLGLGTLFKDGVKSFTDSTNGVLTAQKSTMQSLIDDMDQSISDLNAQLKLREDTLKMRFLAMETSIAELNSQMQRMQVMFGKAG